MAAKAMDASTCAASLAEAMHIITETLSAPRRVLVVDDNRDAADSLAALLTMLGHKVAVAYDGLEVVKITRTFEPQAVVLDIGLPEIDGCEVARQLRAESTARNMLLIALTGYGGQDDVRRALDAGFDAYLLKPTALDSLQGLLASIP